MMAVLFASFNLSSIAKSWLRRTTVTQRCATSCHGRATNRRVSNNCCLYIKRTVTSGESLDHKGSVVIFGDVEEGASVAAEGDIIVVGQIHGICHAGRNGNKESVVVSMDKPEGFQRVSLTSDGVSSFTAARSLVRAILNSSPPARAALFTGAYITVAGISFYIFPDKLFELLFRMKSVATGWIQAVATIAVVFGIYYVGTALGDCLGIHGASAFYISTVIGRVYLFCSFCWLVVTGAVPPPLLIVGSINLFGALYMLKALQKRE